MSTASTTSTVSIVGVGHFAFGRHDPDLTGMAMGAHAIRAALADAGLSWADIDYAVGGSNVSGKPDTLVSQLGLTGVPFVNVRNGCATGGVALATAANAIRAGEAELALVVGFDKHGRGAFAASPADYGHKDWYAQTGLMVTTQFFAMKDRRYLHEHGLKERLLAQVAAKAFRCGEINPDAWRRTAISEDEILNARVINPPLTQYMLCSPSEGATAVVLARGDRAADLCQRPVRLAAVAKRTRRFGSFEVFAPWLPSQAGVSPSVDAAKAVFATAGISPSDVQVAQLQDTDSGAEIYHMAETGLCEHGEQQQLLDLDETAPTGRLPINTDGGCLANGEPVGASGLRQVREVVLQLQGRAGARQVGGAPSVGFTHVYGAPGISACTVLRAGDAE
jgi:acetyl-CoA acetyltransferase